MFRIMVAAALAGLVAGTASAAVFSPETGNAYAYIPDELTFAGALSAARLEVRTFRGVPVRGHLATITSQAENDVAQAFNRSVWIAGAERADAPGTWEWVAGAEAGQVFWTGGLGGSAPPGSFANFYPTEPNDQNGNETRLEFTFPGQWNDLPADALRGYLVEFPVSEVPVPAAGLLLPAGLLALGLAGRRRRA